MFLLICKESDTVRYFETLKEIAALLEVDSHDIHHQLKRTGRWDSEDRSFVVIANLPPEEY